MTAGITKDSRSLLIVDDDGPFRTRLVRAFTDRGFDVRGAGDYDEALAMARAETPELALVDLRLPGKSGIDLIDALKQLDATTSIVVLTGYGSITTAVESVRRGATSYLTKPVDADQILAAFDESSRGDSRQLPPGQPLARVEWEHIQRVLTDCEGKRLTGRAGSGHSSTIAPAQTVEESWARKPVALSCGIDKSWGGWMGLNGGLSKHDGVLARQSGGNTLVSVGFREHRRACTPGWVGVYDIASRARKPNAAVAPSSSSMRRSWLYLATRSDRHAEAQIDRRLRYSKIQDSIPDAISQRSLKQA
jgi:two-component system response regulator RegA